MPDKQLVNRRAFLRPFVMGVTWSNFGTCLQAGESAPLQRKAYYGMRMPGRKTDQSVQFEKELSKAFERLLKQVIQDLQSATAIDLFRVLLSSSQEMGGIYFRDVVSGRDFRNAESLSFEASDKNGAITECVRFFSAILASADQEAEPLCVDPHTQERTVFAPQFVLVAMKGEEGVCCLAINLQQCRIAVRHSDITRLYACSIPKAIPHVLETLLNKESAPPGSPR
jgi:hypothetical protein